MDGPAVTPSLRPAGGTGAGHSAAPGRKVLFSAMKNEAPFVLEWVAYHRVIGFDEIVICSNPSNDGLEEILAALAQAGIVTHLRAVAGPDVGPQRVASEAFTREVGYRDGDWYLWLDADEFLNVHAGDRTVDALVEVLGPRQVALICWRVFGSGGNPRFPGRFISPHFATASAPDFVSNLEQKALFRFSPAVHGFARFGINRPRLARTSGLGEADVMAGHGGPADAGVRANQRWLKGADFGKSARVDAGEFGWHHAQINHYVVRTPEFFALKRLRGRGIRPDAIGAANRRHTPAFFDSHDRNEAEDRSILHWQDAVTEEIARLLAIPAVAEAKARSEALVAAALAALAGEGHDLHSGVVPGSGTVTLPVGAQPAAPPVLAAASEAPEPDAPRDTPEALRLDQAFPDPQQRAFLSKWYGEAGTILEYGAGASTLLAAEAGAWVTSVESDHGWAEAMAEYLRGVSDRAAIHLVDIGPTGDWGFPLKLRRAPGFSSYALSVWDRPDFRQPDLVLVDGRFRAACMTAVLLRATRPTTVLFDDYVSRSQYHPVERFARKEETVGRMARFTVTPGPIPPDLVTQAIGWFTDPR